MFDFVSFLLTLLSYILCKLRIQINCFGNACGVLPCCDVRYHFHIKTMFSSSLPPVVCRKAHVQLCFLACICISYCVALCFALFVFVLCFVHPMLPVSLDFPFLIAPSVFSNVYLTVMSLHPVII